MVDKNVVGEFLQAIQPKDSNTDHTYNATVTQVDDQGVVWVQLAGSDIETPTASTSSEVKRGDEVNVQWRNNQLYIAGNYSNPSAGSVRVNAVEIAAQIANQAATHAVEDAGVAKAAAEDAKATADSVHGIAVQAQADADEAKTSAQNASEYAARALGNLSTVQSVTETLTWITQHGTMTLTSDVALDPTHVYFVQDAGGDYVVGGVTYAVVTEPDVADIATYYELTIDESLNNYVGTHLALTSEGLWLIPEVGGNKVLIATGGVGHTYTEAGTYIIDENDNISAQFLEDGTTIYGPSSTLIAHLGYGQGYDPQGQLVDAPYYSLGTRSGAVGNYSIAEGSSTTASGAYSHAEGWATRATAKDSHAEGWGTRATGQHSHAEGGPNTSSGGELFDTTASGAASHAEGWGTQASGSGSHSQNLMTIAAKSSQTALGTYNIEDTSATTTHPNGRAAYGQFAIIVGNGTSSARSNALTVDWSGDVCLALDTTAASGTTDGDLYAAITALGWQSDVIV